MSAMHKIIAQINQCFPRLACFVASLVTLMFVDVASACSVCQGDPSSKMAQGAQAGVLFMAITTYVLLLGMAALVASWFIRQNRNLR